MTNKVLTYILAAMLAIPCMAQQTRELTADKHNEYGLVYSLPLTVLDIEVSAQRTVRKAGPYSMYAAKYLGASDVVMQDDEHWSINDVRVTPRGVADSDRRYLMQLKPGAVTSVTVAEDGMLLGINTPVEMPQTPVQLQGSDLTPSSLDRNEYLQYVGEDFLGAQTRAMKAQLLWEALMDVRNARLALSKGTAETMPTDGRQLELMLASLQQQEQALTEAFTGTVQTQTVVSRYTFVPDDDNAGMRNTLCRISDTSGFTANSGEPVYITIEPLDSPSLPMDEKGEMKKIPKDAVMYALPGSAEVTIKIGNRQLWQQEVQMAQYGTVFGLAPGLFTDKKVPSYAIFDPVTGALRTIAEKK